MLLILGHSGEWRCGMREGFGVMVYSKDQSYEGEWVRNKRHGWGRMSYSDGSYYEVIQLPYNSNGAQSLIKHLHTCFIPGWVDLRGEGGSGHHPLLQREHLRGRVAGGQETWQGQIHSHCPGIPTGVCLTGKIGLSIEYLHQQEGWWHSDQLKCSLCSKIYLDSSTTCLPPLGLQDYQSVLKEQKSKIFNSEME